MSLHCKLAADWQMAKMEGICGHFMFFHYEEHLNPSPDCRGLL